MALLVLLHEGLTIKKYQIEKTKVSIGRNPDCDIFLEDKMASKNHARIELKDNLESDGTVDYFIEDLGSTNHTFVNGEKISRQKLNHDDKITIGKHNFRFMDESASQDERTTKLHKSWIPGVYYTKE
jgi:pSer/pThr/pTyr-binding forkhead associated (FHA) protein